LETNSLLFYYRPDFLNIEEGLVLHGFFVSDFALTRQGKVTSLFEFTR